MSARPQTVVVVPARDEEERIGACIGALAAQEGLSDGSWAVVVVVDCCVDATAAVARRAANAAGLTVDLVEGPGRGVGYARAFGMAWAARRLRAMAPPVLSVLPNARYACIGEHTDLLIASTDADSVVAPDWLARTLAAVAAGAEAVGGRIALDPEEARRLPSAALAARDAEAEHRLAAVRGHAPDAEHHQFSGASLALTLAAYDAVGGVPAVAALEDEALERALRAAGRRIAYAADVRVTTSARTDGRVPRGLAQVLRTTAWQARQRPARARSGDSAPTQEASAADPAPALESRVRAADGVRGDAIHAALARAGALVVVLGPGVEAADAAPLAAALRADPSLQLVRAVEELPDPLAELVARPALNLHAPELAVLASPLTRTWAARRTLLEALALPHGDAVDLTVLVDTWARHGLAAIAELPVTGPPPPTRADAPLVAYELLAALAARFGEPPARSSAFSDPAGTRRARLDEHAPRPLDRSPETRAAPPPRIRARDSPRPGDRAAARVTLLLLVRHGESTWNAEGRWQGQADPPLSPRGEAQARAAAPAVAALAPFDGVHCSPLVRARRTAELLAAAAGLAPPQPAPGLEERAAGPWTGLTHAEIDARHPGARAGGWRPDGYEAVVALRTRVTAALTALEGERLLVVVHEGVLRALDDDPAKLPNLAARWFACADGVVAPDGPRLALAVAAPPAPAGG